jgi:transposase
MALGRRGEQEPGMWVATTSLPRSAGHPFYTRMNALLAEAKFDAFAEAQCAPHYAETLGRPSIPPGVYFRMLLVGYFEGLDAQRAIAWRCSDSLALREFLGLGMTKPVPEHSSLTVTRQRLPLSVHEAVFARILELAATKGLLRGKTVAVDATTLEANAAMKSIVRRATGETWRQYIRRLATEEGVANPTDEDARRLDRRRKKKRVSNADWQSGSDPASRITKMKDGRTHLAYKAEHVIDLDSEVILAPQIYPGDAGDTATVETSVQKAEAYGAALSMPVVIEEVVADKGYHAAATLAACAAVGLRTYIPEPQCERRRWDDKPAAWELAYRDNRRRVRGARSRRLQRRRSERVERSFAHTCGSGNQRRTWLRGLENVQKRYLLTAAARNLGLVMRHLFGIGTPRSLQGFAARVSMLGRAVVALLAAVVRVALDPWTSARRTCATSARSTLTSVHREIRPSSTGC